MSQATTSSLRQAGISVPKQMAFSSVFMNEVFLLSPSLSTSIRDRLNRVIMAGSGRVIGDASRHNAPIIVKAHGDTDDSQSPSHPSHAPHRIVSSHWVFKSHQANRLIDPSAHLVLRPLPCAIPLPGFAPLRICVSQYSGARRDYILCLCGALGALRTEKLDRRITHLVCSWAHGDKYELATRWGDVAVVTEEWLHACVRANGIVPPGPYHPPR
ncbi:hypothetical protein CLOM_g13335 [Closterium sp. NIES-68]|nr:hypothetical protein CLOM_g13335 [Closterium sp. NIES-68]